MTEDKQRTGQQNKAMHLWFTQYAQCMNEEGLDMRVVIKPEVDIPWGDQAFKEMIWRPIQKAVTGKESSRELTTKECTEISDIINRHLGEKFGVHVPFPDAYEQSLNKGRV